MANINRTIRFKRNTNIAPSAASAKQAISSIAGTLANGEIVIGSYTDEKAVNGVCHIISVKGQDKIFFIDNQTILNKIGIKDDGTIDPNASADSVVKLIDDLASGASDVAETVDLIIAGAGLENDGTYAADTTDKFISGATSLKNADKKLSDEIKEVEDFIGMSEDATGKSIVEKIDEISGKTDELRDDVDELSGKTETLSGKTITDVENTTTVNLSKENASDGTKKIKADVNVSQESGNILITKNDGLYTQVDYNPLTNAIIVNGEEKQLNVGSIVNKIEYSGETEQLVIYYTDTSGGTHETVADMAGIIEEYEFASGATEEYNVVFDVTRNVSGATTVKAKIDLIDCGEY